MSLSEWLEVAAQDREKIHIHGFGLHAIATILGVEGDPINSAAVYFTLVGTIYGTEDPVLQKNLLEARKSEEIKKADEKMQAFLGNDLNKWRGEIRKVYSAETWAKLASNQRRGAKIHGKGLESLAKLYSVVGNPYQHTYVHLALGLAIFDSAEEQGLLKPLYVDAFEAYRGRVEIGKSKKNRVEQVRERYSTVEMWLAVDEPEKIDFGGVKLNGLAEILGIKGKSIKELQIKIAIEVYGDKEGKLGKQLETEQSVILARLGNDASAWRDEIQRTYPYPQWLIDSHWKTRRNIKVYGKGIVALARIFGIQGNLFERKEPFDELCKAIWGKVNGDK